jgi:hypothetical protein
MAERQVSPLRGCAASVEMTDLWIGDLAIAAVGF